MYGIEVFSSSLDKVLTEGSEDFNLIVSVYNTLVASAPITNNAAQARVSVLDSLRPQLVALSFMITSKLNRLNTTFNNKYYPLVNRWSIAGTKRSLAEIEAQIYKDNADLLIMKGNIDDYNNVSYFVQSLIKSLDQSRNSAIEVWRSRL